MKTGWIKRALSIILTGAMIFNLALAGVYADDAPGKYVSDVFIAYGKTEADATKWLKDNGWEPVAGDFNAGKASFFDDNKLQDQNVAAVMGIKRTDNEDAAITDIAVMNMKGGYSMPAYEELIKEKKAQIDEFINSFMAVIDEYRANYNGEGSSYGQKRAQMDYDRLNKFYDGNPEGEFAVNDTGMKLGDLFLAATRQEGDENGGDLQQLLLESSGPAMFAVEALLTVATDPGEDTWIQRASGLTGDELAENLEKYVPEAAGQDISESVAVQYLSQAFEDTAVLLAEQWTDINDGLKWFEAYNDEHGLWQKKGESDDAFSKRLAKYFEDLQKSDEDAYNEVSAKYPSYAVLYDGLPEVSYEGEWGGTLFDFFNPEDGSDYTGETEYFLPMAAALSEGQRVGIEYMSLRNMLLIGLGTEEGMDQILPDLNEIMDGQDEMDIFTGINRGIFRGGVALTSEALMEQNAGKGQAFDKIWDNTGIVAIASYAAMAVGGVTVGCGAIMAIAGKGPKYTPMQIQQFEETFNRAKAAHSKMMAAIEDGTGQYSKTIAKEYVNADKNLSEARNATATTKMGVAGRWMMGIGGALLIGAAIVKGVQMWKYYQRDMTPIPLMIVDESDIVTYVTDDEGKPVLDENGDQKKNIEFNDYEFYQAVRCNRPEVGEIGDWQDGVKEYADHGCYDVADLNADMGQEWIALYTVKSESKGDPILADSLTMQYGSNKTPNGCTKGLHLFTYTNTVDLGDTAWAFNNDKKGVYFFWDEDEGAFAAETASAFSGGQLALAGIAGLILGIGGSTLVVRPRRKKEESEEPATTA